MKKKCDQSSQGLTGLSGPIATFEIVLRYALSTLTKHTDFNFSRFLIFLLDILFNFLKANFDFEMQLGIL